MTTIIIVAMTRDRLIGRGGRLPWHDSDDLQHFKRTTMGHAVIMGRKTFESIGRPLPGRRNIVITRNPKAISATALDVVNSLEAALTLCRQRNEQKAFIIGGAQIYELALPIADEMIITWMPGDGASGDTYFPAWNAVEWRPGEPHDPVFSRALRYVRVR